MCGLGLMNLLMFIEPLNEWRDSILPFARGNEESGLYNHRNFCSNMIMMVLLVSLSIAVWFNQLGWKAYSLCFVMFRLSPRFINGAC